jgi:hypothetical protein
MSALVALEKRRTPGRPHSLPVRPKTLVERRVRIGLCVCVGGHLVGSFCGVGVGPTPPSYLVRAQLAGW